MRDEILCLFLQYRGCHASDDVIKWFWAVVSQFKEEEKALLLKFTTGSPCVPVGGFAALQVCFMKFIIHCLKQKYHRLLISGGGKVRCLVLLARVRAPGW